MCPHCHKNAPVVHRGLVAYCTACGRERPPFAGKSVSLAGKPSKVGGAVAGVLGWLVLIGGVSMALLLGLLASALFPHSIAGLVIGLPLGFLSFAFGLLLLISGRKLTRTGVETAREAHVQAIFSLAANRGGVLTAQDVSLALDVPAPQADALLTELAKERSDDVTVEVGERGEIFYAFPGLAPRPRVRVPQPGVRIDPRAGEAAPDADALDQREELSQIPPPEERRGERLR